MLLDLAAATSDQHATADVAVIGAGLVGLVAASELSRRGYRVVVAECGDRSQVGETHPLNEVETLSHAYRGASDGRFRCLGGTSSRWGGAFLPYLPEDMGPHTAGWDADWPIGQEEIARFLPRVEELFEIVHGPYDGTSAGTDPRPGELRSFAPRAAKWPTFTKRNVANIFHAQISNDRQFEVYLNTTVTALKFREGRFCGYLARTLGGRTLDVDAPLTLVAAGAIESTRLLLTSANAADGPQFGPALGRYFHDHLSAVAAHVDPVDRAGLTRRFSYRFVRGGMRNWRLELTGAARKADMLPAAFAHVAFRSPESSGFDAVRVLFQSLQKASLPPGRVVAQLATELPWLTAASFWRFAYRTVLPPANATFDLHLVTEQRPRSRNRITLSDHRRDAFGIPLACIDWEVGETDIDVFLALQARLIGEWTDSVNAALAAVRPRAIVNVVDDLIAGGGIFHPAGSTRMGTSPETSVLDGDLVPHGMQGLRVVSTSAFPSVGGANPGLTLLCLTMRAVQQIDRQLALGA